MSAVFRKPGEGRVYGRPSTGGAVTIKIASGDATIFETSRPAGDSGGPGLHNHPAFDESFYVLEGEWDFTAGDQTIRAEAGTLVHIPRGVFHSFKSTGRAAGKLIGFTVPGGIELFFEEVASTGDDRAAGARHGINWATAPGVTEQ